MTRSLIATLISAQMAIVPALAAEQACNRDAMLVFDGSGSMSEMGFNQLDQPRIFEAREAMRVAIPQIAANRDIGLIVYGPGPNGTCQNIDLRFGPIPDAAGPIIDAVDTLQPAGDTPLTESVARAAEVLKVETNPAIIVLVTDGKETCFGEPCVLAERLASNSADLTIHVIGFKVRAEFFNWERKGEDNAIAVARCLADRNGGAYHAAESVQDLADALRAALGCPFLSQYLTDQRALDLAALRK